MSRSGYSEDGDDDWAIICAMGALKKATNGARGQALLRDALAALDAMDPKELIDEVLHAGGAYCVLGAVGAARGIDLERIDSNDWAQVAKAFNVAPTLARELMFQNDDEFGYDYVSSLKTETAIRQRRWSRVRDWVVKQLVVGAP